MRVPVATAEPVLNLLKKAELASMSAESPKPIIGMPPEQAVQMRPVAGVVPVREVKVDIRQFDGLNTRKAAKPSESPDMQNMSADAYPLATARPPRETKYTGTGTARALFASTKLCAVIGTSLIWDLLGTPAEKITGLAAGDKSIIDFNGCVIVFPDKKYYDYIGNTTGTLTCSYDIDLATVWMNRIWGVKGDDIHVSAQGDKDAWEPVVDDPTSAWHTDTGSQGAFTSIRTYGSHAVLKKAGTVTYEAYGSKSSNFQIIEVVTEGSINNKGDVELLGGQYYLGVNGIMRYGGGYPELLSLQLSAKYTDGVLGADGRHLYFCAYDGAAWSLMVYDPIFDLWVREDNLQVVSFAHFGGYLYALTAASTVIKFRSGTETISWYRDTFLTDDGSMDPKENQEIWVEIDADATTVVTVSTRAGNRATAYVQVGQFTTTAAGLQVIRFPLASKDVIFTQVRIACDKAADLHWIQRVVVSREG